MLNLEKTPSGGTSQHVETQTLSCDQASATNTQGRSSFSGVDRVTLMKRKLLIMFTAKASGSWLLSDVIDTNITVLPHTCTI